MRKNREERRKIDKEEEKGGGGKDLKSGGSFASRVVFKYCPGLGDTVNPFPQAFSSRVWRACRYKGVIGASLSSESIQRTNFLEQPVDINTFSRHT